MKQALVILFAVSLFFVGCSKDETGNSDVNVFKFNGKEYPIQWANINYDVSTWGNSYSMQLSTNESANREYDCFLYFVLSESMMNTDFSLTTTATRWIISFYGKDFMAYNATNTNLDNLKNGSGSVKIVDESTKTYEVKLLLTFTDGKTANVYYKGKFKNDPW